MSHFSSTPASSHKLTARAASERAKSWSMSYSDSRRDARVDSVKSSSPTASQRNAALELRLTNLLQSMALLPQGRRIFLSPRLFRIKLDDLFISVALLI